MNALRWLLGIIAALLGGGWLLLALWGQSFRRSFGASDLGPLVVIAVPALMLLVLAAVLWPGQRGLLHVTSAAMAVAAIALVHGLGEMGFAGLMGLAFCAAWFAFYGLTIASSAP